MIVTDTAYGILLTDDFGGFFKSFRDFEKFKPTSYHDDDDYEIPEICLNNFCVSCPSAEDYQFVLGISVRISKTMNIEEIHKKWLEYMDNLPEEIKNVLKNIDSSKLEPDFQIMAGHC